MLLAPAWGLRRAENMAGFLNKTMSAVVDGTPQCTVLNGGDFYSIALQCVLGVIALTALLLKRKLENPKREFNIWALDIGKQCSAQLLGHFAGIITSEVLNQYSKASDECSWYFLAYAFGTVGLDRKMYSQYIVLAVWICTNVAFCA